MSPKEKATWMMSIYNSQYEDYQRKAALDDLTEDEKELLRKKKEILVKVYNPIKVYTGYADTGVIPDAELETMIIQNLELLMGVLE